MCVTTRAPRLRRACRRNRRSCNERPSNVGRACARMRAHRYTLPWCRFVPLRRGGRALRQMADLLRAFHGDDAERGETRRARYVGSSSNQRIAMPVIPYFFRIYVRMNHHDDLLPAIIGVARSTR